MLLIRSIPYRYFFLLTILLVSSCQRETTIQTGEGQIEIEQDELLKIVGEAYLYGYPLVLMDMTKQVITNVETPHPVVASAPVNQLGQYKRFPDHTSNRVVKPNVDTYYSIAWLDVAKEPQVLSMPATDRYHVLQFMDAYTNVFAAPGSRTIGAIASDFLITGPNWEGTIPEGMTHIDAPTEMVWMIGRIQVNSVEDGSTTVQAIQDKMRLVPLKEFGNTEYIPPKGLVKKEWQEVMPSKAIQELDATTFLNRVAQLMVDNPPAEADSTILKKMAKIGLVAGKPFELKTDNIILKTKLSALPKFIHNKMEDRRDNPDPKITKNGWNIFTKELGSYGTDYNIRAYVGFIGLGANLPADAVYPNCVFDINGDRLEASKNYQLHFEENDLPPVHAFWSLTAYNSDEFLYKNDLNRYALGDRDPLTYNEDGSLDFYIQHAPPSDEKLSNWLPIPEEGRFTLIMRLYHPKEEILNGKWIPPHLVPVEKG